MTDTSLSSLKWLLYAAMATACFVVMFLCTKLASADVTPFLYAFVVNFMNLVGHFLVLVRAKATGRLPSFALPVNVIGLAALVGLFITSNDTSAVYMFKTGAPLSVAMPVFTAGNVLLTVLFGLVIMKERLCLKQVIGILGIIAGIILLNV